MDICETNNFVKLETKSEFPRRREGKRPIPFGSDNPPKRLKRSEEKRVVSYINESRYIADRYKNLKLIGKGSFGIVYRAEPKDLSRKYVAIKEILRPITGRKDDQHHVVCEIELVQKLGGKNNILPCFEVHRDMGNFVVMEYFPHDDFKTIVKDMDASEIIMYMKNLISSLNYLSLKNIIHRDVKPDNFLYNRKQKRYALIDFGLAQYYNNNLDRAEALKRQFGGSLGGANSRRSTIEMPCLCEGKLIPPCASCQIKPQFVVNKAGTPRFLAPEVLIGVNKQTSKIDIWAAGMILFYLITKKYPFFYAKDNLAMVSELASVFGTQSFIEVAKEYSMDLSFGFSFRPLNIIQFVFSHRYENMGGLLSLPIHCDYCNEYFQESIPAENRKEIGCYCRQMEITEASETLNDALDREMAQMLIYCLQVNPSKRISSDDFVNKFPLTNLN